MSQELLNEELHTACQAGGLDVVLKALYDGADKNSQIENGMTPLMEAIFYENFHIVEELLVQNVDLNIRDSLGFTALHFAVTEKNIKLTQKLLDVDARTDLGDL